MTTLRRLIAFGVFAIATALIAAEPLDEFFIISSVDAAHGRLVVKRPTDGTVVLIVTDKTAIRDERGEPLRMASLRSGDTIYAVAVAKPAGEITASSIRRGPMTVEQLHRRYLRF
ncbi:MAG TPA: hypothetical protein VEZ11_03285 [Thermoanaerobaculia bacterium]|nr:hypothetical protein [Thermoanaerobaculia bacterium]